MKLKHRTLPVLLLIALLATLFFATSPVAAQDPTCIGVDCPPSVGEEPPVTPPATDADVWKSFLLLAVVVQRLVDPLKQTWKGKPGEHTYDFIAAAVAGILLALMFQINIFAAAGLQATAKWAAYTAIVVSGYLMAFGAGVLNDLLSKFKKPNGATA